MHKLDCFYFLGVIFWGMFYMFACFLYDCHFFFLVLPIDAKIIWINSMLELCLRLKLLKLILIFYSLGVTFFSFKFVISSFWQFFCCLHFSLNLHHFFHSFPNKNYQGRKFWNQKKMWVGEGGLIQLFNAFTKLYYFDFSKGNESKTYSYIIKN